MSERHIFTGPHFSVFRVISWIASYAAKRTDPRASHEETPRTYSSSEYSRGTQLLSNQKIPLETL